MTSPQRLLFIGDSVTDCGRREDPEGLGFGYVRVIAGALPDAEVINRGISGNRVPDLAARWQADLLDLAPDVLTILIGINDTWRRYDSNDPTSTEAYETGYRALLETVRGVPLVLMEPFVLPIDEGQRAWHPQDLDAKIAVVHRLAEEFGATLVPLNARLTELAAAQSPEAIADDGVHPTAHGHDLIAQEWLGRERRAP